MDYPPRAVLPGLPDCFCNDGTCGNFQGTQHHQKARCRIYGRRNSCGYAEIFLARVLGHFRIRVLRSLGLFCGSVGILYNTFTFADVAIVIVVALLLFSSKSFVRLVNEKSTEESADETESGDTSADNADGKAA